MCSHVSSKVAASEPTCHLLKRRLRARERVSDFHFSMMTSSDAATHVPSFGFCSELSKVANANYFDDISRFRVFSKIFRFGLLKAQ